MKAGEGTPPLNTFMESYSTLWRKSWKSTWNSIPQGLIHYVKRETNSFFSEGGVGLPVFCIWSLLSPAIRLPQAVAKHNPADAVMVFHSILLPAPSLYCHLHTAYSSAGWLPGGILFAFQRRWARESLPLKLQNDAHRFDGSVTGALTLGRWFPNEWKPPQTSIWSSPPALHPWGWQAGMMWLAYGGG